MVEHKDYFEKIDDRTRPDSYEEQLVPEAISFLNGVFRNHPKIWMHLVNNGKASKSLQQAEDLQALKGALFLAFGDDVVHMLETAEEDLDKAAPAVFAGKNDLTLAEIYAEKPEMILHIRDVTIIIKGMIVSLKEDFLPTAREPVLSAGPLH